MLALLKIRNLALVDELSWELGPGLISVTGETGAGKSVIVGALKMILGERADKGLIRTGEESCTIEAVFDLRNPAEILAILQNNGLPDLEDTQLIIRRVIGNSTNRQYINDSPVTLNLLKRLGECLVDLHGPHDHQSLLSQDRQLAMLDAFANTEELLSDYRRAYREWRDKTTQYKEIQNAENTSGQALELLRFQLEEIETAAITEADGEDLQERYNRSSNSNRLLELASQAVSVLNGDDAILDRFADLQRICRDLQRFDPSLTQDLAGLESLGIELRDLELNLTNYAGELEIDPLEASEIEERVNTVESLKRKYGPEISDILARKEDIASQLDLIDNRASNLEQLLKELTETRDKVEQIAKKITQHRIKAGPKLAKDISRQLKELGFKQSSFEIELSKLKEPTSNGLDSCNFLFGPNPGEPLHPLRQIASSGEISRVMLAVKSSLAEQDSTPLMVFDEIDANVGGEIARAVGKKMALLGKLHQVIAITHFPQVAATASAHFVVEKEIVSGRTRSKLFPVHGEQRIDELVRMLGGGSQQARAMAASLLEPVH